MIKIVTRYKCYQLPSMIGMDFNRKTIFKKKVSHTSRISFFSFIIFLVFIPFPLCSSTFPYDDQTLLYWKPYYEQNVISIYKLQLLPFLSAEEVPISPDFKFEFPLSIPNTWAFPILSKILFIKDNSLSDA